MASKPTTVKIKSLLNFHNYPCETKGTVIDEVVVELMDNYRRTYDETYLPAFVRVIEDPPEKGEGSD